RHRQLVAALVGEERLRRRRSRELVLAEPADEHRPEPARADSERLGDQDRARSAGLLTVTARKLESLEQLDQLAAGEPLPQLGELVERGGERDDGAGVELLGRREHG